MYTSGLITINLRGRIWSLLLLLLALSSCETTEDWGADSPGGSLAPKEALLTFRIKDKLYPESYGVKTGAVFDEASFCDSLYVLIFKNNGTDWRYERGRTLKKTRQLADGGYEYTLLLPDDLKDIPLTMLVCANAGEVITSTPDDKFSELPADGGIHKVGRKLAEVEKMLVFKVPEDAADPFKSGWYGGGKSNIPMCARMNNVSFTYDKAGKWTFNGTADGTLNVGLFRSVLRVDVGLNYKLSGQNLLANRVQGLSNFKISALYVAYSSDSVALPPVDAPAVLNVFGSGSVDMMGFRAAAACDSIEQRLYMAETDNNVRTNDKRPCAIVEGEYTPAGTTTPVKGYYRMDFVDSNGDYIVLKRNTLVRFNIKEVKGRGFDTKEQALKSKPSNIDVEITAYTEITGDTHFNGQYYISLSKSEVTMPREKGVEYTVLANTNVEDWAADVKLSLDKTNWGDTATDANFSFEKVSDTAKGIYGLKITTLAEWTQDVNATLYLKVKNMDLSLSVTQVNLGLDTWKNGSVEDGSIELDNNYSQKAFYFLGKDATQKLSYFTLFTLDTKIQIIDAADSWLTYTLEPSGDLSLQVKANLTGLSRKAIIKIIPRTGGFSTDIKVVQESCQRGNIRIKNGFFATYNYGATDIALDGELVQDPSDKYCPVGWHLTTVLEIGAVMDANTDVHYDKNSGMVYSSQNFYSHIPEGRYAFWTDETDVLGYAKIKYKGSTTIFPKSLSYIRCVRSFRIKKHNVTLQMDGGAQYVEYYSRNNERLTTPIQKDGFIISDAGSNLLKVERKPNITNAIIKSNIYIQINDGDNIGTVDRLSVSQQPMCKPSTNNDGEYLKVGRVEWFPWNVGVDASVKKSEYAAVLPGSVKGKYLYFTQDTVQEGTAKELAEQRCGIRMALKFTPGSKCPSGWRLPSVAEWDELYKRVKIAKFPVAKTSMALKVDSVTAFFATDGNVITYFPLGFSADETLSGADDTDTKGYDSYFTSDYAYVVRKYYDDKPMASSIHVANKSHRFFLITDKGERFHYVRCVRSF